MSMNSMYQNTKKEKREAGENKVLYHTAHADMKNDLQRIQSSVDLALSRFQSVIDSVNANLQRQGEQLAELKKLDLAEFSNQHERMKGNYNKFVLNANENLIETTNVVMDIAKRVNEIEARLAL